VTRPELNAASRRARAGAAEVLIVDEHVLAVDPDSGTVRCMTGGSERHGPEEVKGEAAFHRHLVRPGFIEYDRVIFFSDAVFAIAITLLAINLRVPMGNFHALHALRDAGSNILGFVISFTVIAFFWVGHHAIFRYFVTLDRTLIALNLLFLGTIAFLPYPTDLLSQSKADAAAVIFYASCGAAAGLAEAGIWLYATYSHRGLASDSAQPIRLFVLLRTLRIPVVFVISIPVAVFHPRAAMFVWFLIWISGALINRLAPRSVAAEEADAPEQTD
jgi:uncharacterized membrane protein